MADETDQRLRTISVRRDGTALVSINALVSRGLQDVAALVALGSDALVVGSASFSVLEDEDEETWEASEGLPKLRRSPVESKHGAVFLNKEMAMGLGKAIRGLVKAGVYDFATFIKHAVDALGLENVRHYGEHFRAMWDKIREAEAVMQPSRPVADILKELEDATNQKADAEARVGDGTGVDDSARTPEGVEAGSTQGADAESERAGEVSGSEVREVRGDADADSEVRDGRADGAGAGDEAGSGPDRGRGTRGTAAQRRRGTSSATLPRFGGDDAGRSHRVTGPVAPKSAKDKPAANVQALRILKALDAGKVAEVLGRNRDGNDQKTDGKTGIRGDSGVDCRDGASEGNNTATKKVSFQGLGVVAEGPVQANTGLDPKLMKLAFEAAVASMEAGVKTFAVFVETVYNEVPDLIEQVAPYLEIAWRVAHERYPKKVGPAGKVADVLKEIRDGRIAE